MSDLNLDVSSPMTQEDRDLGKPPPVDQIDYLPWGTRSLKLRLSGDYKGLVNVRPEPTSDDADYIASYTQEGQDIQFSWGGGWEQGVEIKRKKGDENYVFFNVTHLGDDAAERYTTDVVARDRNGGELTRRKVTLSRPAKMFPGLLKPSWQQVDGNLAELKLLPRTAGEQPVIPFYESRWWPGAWIRYDEFSDAGTPPEITLRCRRDAGEGRSQVELFARHAADQESTLLATIGGDLQFPLVDLRHISVDLSSMAGHWAVRVWFWWLDKGVAQKLAGKITADESKELSDWSVVQEIPDAERVDLVFDNQFRPKFVCTDLHWHELWAPVEENEPVKASIAGTSRYQVYIRGTEGLRVVVSAQTRKIRPSLDDQYDPSTMVMDQLINPGGHHLGGGAMDHKHTPYFHDLDFEADLTSSDVRHG